MNKVQLILGDCIEEMKELEDNSVDSIVTDPPYELGFMGKKWDSTGIANNVDMWKECLRVLKPGGHLLAFSGTRTYHRMASAIEDAGFEVRDMIEWVYASGFPKSHNIGKAVDKLRGNEREVFDNPLAKKQTASKEGAIHGSRPANTHISKGNSKHEGWGTALKPAHEPICMARKPLSEKTIAKNCLKWGTGGINIDESRVGTTEQDKYDLEQRGISKGSGVETNINFTGRDLDLKHGVQELGRFPANIIHDNSEEVRECFPETKSGGGNKGNVKDGTGMFGSGKAFDTPTVEADSGNASRFFKSIIYQAKASKSERKLPDNTYSSHPTVKPIALMEYLIKMVTPKGGTVLDPFMGSGSTGVACIKSEYGFIGIDMTPEYVEIAKSRLNLINK